MKKVYGVVLIGCGHIGMEHIADIYYRDNIRIVGVVDQIEKQAALFARKYGALSYSTDYREYLNRDDVDIIIVATYVRTHLQILEDCLKAGKHVLCEKPMVGSLGELDRFEETVRAYPACKVKIAHILRFNATYQKVAGMIQSGMIGEIRLIRMAQNHHIMNKKRYYTLLEDCPPIVDCGVHYVDVIRWFTGPQVKTISGIGCRVGEDVPQGEYNYGMLTMKLSNGAAAYYEAAWADTTASGNLKEFIGDRGRIRITLQTHRFQDQEEGDLIEYYDAVQNVYHTINVSAPYKNMWMQLSDLIEMIEKDLPVEPSLSEAAAATRLALSGDRAIREHKIFRVDERGRIVE